MTNTHHDAIRIAEVGFALMAVAGGLVAVGALVSSRSTIWNAIGGLALAAGGVLVIVAAHWGHFG